MDNNFICKRDWYLASLYNFRFIHEKAATSVHILPDNTSYHIIGIENIWSCIGGHRFVINVL